MKLEKQVCSSEVAKKLEELGIKQESLYYWVGEEKDKLILSQQTNFFYGSAPGLSEAEYLFVYSAFTVAELGEMLPHHIEFEDLTYYLFCHFGKYKRKVICDYHTYDRNYRLDDGRIFAETEADVRAKMLIYLLENNLMSKDYATKSA